MRWHLCRTCGTCGYYCGIRYGLGWSGLVRVRSGTGPPACVPGMGDARDYTRQHHVCFHSLLNGVPVRSSMDGVDGINLCLCTHWRQMLNQLIKHSAVTVCRCGNLFTLTVHVHSTHSRHPTVSSLHMLLSLSSVHAPTQCADTPTHTHPRWGRPEQHQPSSTSSTSSTTHTLLQIHHAPHGCILDLVAQHPPPALAGTHPPWFTHHAHHTSHMVVCGPFMW